MAVLEPEMILKFGFTPGINIGYIPQQITWYQTGILTFDFLPKQGTSWYPYDPDDLVVKGATPTSGGGNGNGNPGGGGAGTIPTSPLTSTVTEPNTTTSTTVVSGLVRPHTPQLFANPARVSPGAFMSKGVKLDILVDQAASVMVYVEASYKTGKKGKAKEHHLTNVTTKELQAGLQQVTVAANSAGRKYLKSHPKVESKVVVVLAYADKTTKTLTHTLLIAAAAHAKS